MTHPKFPSEEQGGYDPIPTHPEPLSPQHNTVEPEEPDGDDLAKDERGKPAEPREKSKS
jgi:hypothetical protein